MKAIRSLFVVGAALVGLSSVAAAQTIGGFTAGVDFAVVKSPPATPQVAGKVQVAEIFMYGCPHCFALEPALEKWVAGKPADVDFVRIPAPWNEMALVHARAYLAAKKLGKADAANAAFFSEVHERGNRLETKQKVTDFYARFGADPAAFAAEYDANIDEVRAVYELIGSYGVEGTPAIVVAGKYVTSGSMSGSYEKWFAIVDALIAHERGARN